MAYTDIDKPSEHFNTVTYTGNGGTQSITGVGFQPDWTWLKRRDSADWHTVYDAVRGATKVIYPNTTNAEDTDTIGLTSFDSDGFTLGSRANANLSGATFVSWNWKANGSGSANTDGSINSTVSTNTTSGFSIVSYTGNGTAGATVGHGLGASPKIVILKDRDNSTAWVVGGDAIGTTDNNYLLLNETNALDSASTGFQSFSTTTVGLGSDTWFNGSSRNYIAYCFAEKKGYSKFGSYTGNGSTDGTFVYTGFKPAFVMIKRTDSATSWQLIDNKRSDAGGNNVIDKVLAPNASDAEYDEGSANWFADFVSNGFKLRNSFGASNTSGATHIYMAFAENPFVTSTGVPATAR